MAIKRKLYFAFLRPALSLVMTLFTIAAISQSVPEFKIKLTNGTTVSSTKLSGKKPLLLIYFAPDCEHCQVLTKQLLQKINNFKNTEILIVSFQSLGDVAVFKKQYKIGKYPNIKLGIEIPVFFLKNYYHLQHTPFTALFNKNGKLMVSYKEYTPVDELIKWVKAIEKK